MAMKCRKCENYGNRRRDLGCPNKKMESTVKMDRREWTTYNVRSEENYSHKKNATGMNIPTSIKAYLIYN
jgi:hypothetical protein